LNPIWKMRVLLPGGYEDPMAEALSAMRARVTVLDPALNGLTLAEWSSDIGHQEEVDIVIAASVLEHVKDDAEFLRDIVTMLRPGGYAFLTCDFKEGWKRGDPLAPTQERMYTRESLMALTDTIDSEVEWCGERDWQARGDYFPYAGLWFSFASIAFKKRDAA